MYLVKYDNIRDNINVYYSYECNLARNCKRNIKLLHCTVNNIKIHAPYDMYDNYSQNTCSSDSEVVMKMEMLLVMVVECNGEVLMN